MSSQTHQSTNASTFLLFFFTLQKILNDILNTLLHCSNKYCENDKYVFLLQGQLTIIFCSLSCFVCSQCMSVFVVQPFLCFLLQIRTFLTLSRGGRRSAWSQSRQRFSSTRTVICSTGALNQMYASFFRFSTCLP